MFHIRQDEYTQFKKGFNFFPLNDKFSFGFTFLNIKNNIHTLYWFRYSKLRKNWIIKKDVVDIIEVNKNYNDVFGTNRQTA